MDHGERRIHSLKLRGDNDALLLRARYRLEEAFRTTTLPGLPPNAQVLVRHLDLGSIGADVSPVTLAAIISDRVSNLVASAVCLDLQSRPDADVVWFSDPLQPYVVLLTQLLDGKPANEWYWRSLFPRKLLTLSSETFEVLMTEASGTPLKGVAQTRILQHIMAPQRLARLCSIITPEFAMRMLHGYGLSPVEVRWKRTHDQTRRFDNAVAGRVIKPISTPDLSPDWKHVVQFAASYWGVEDVRTLWCAWHALLVHSPAYRERKETLQRINVAAWLESWSTHARDPTPHLWRLDEARQHLSPSPEWQVLGDSIVSPLREHVTVRPISEQGTGGDLSLRGHDDASGKNAPSASSKNTRVKEVPAHFSHHAGFAFMIPLLQRLGMSELLLRNDVLLEYDFPRRFLWAMAERFAVAEDDAVRQLFEAWEPGGDCLLEEIRIPDHWPQMTTRSDRPLLRHPTTLHGLINTTQLMAALYLRRFCGISLRTLVQRPGRVLLTPTHWDVIFDINQTDLHLRRVALDTDPGWVAWLGRVVQFHYDSEGQRYV